MKICIWCKKDESQNTFNTLAHSIPKSLGGKNICKNVCDKCNNYFGNIQDKLPSVEETLKEIFYISRVRLLGKENIGKNKALARIKSTYFNIDVVKSKMSLKPRFLLEKHFQEKLIRQFKRGIYKIFLEELEINKNSGLNIDFDFIRNFAKENNGNLPVFYFNRINPHIVSCKEWIISPNICFEFKTMKYLIQNEIFFEFELLGHVFGIAINKDWEIEFENYLTENIILKKDLFQNMKIIERVYDIDFTLYSFDRN